MEFKYDVSVNYFFGENYWNGCKRNSFMINSKYYAFYYSN